MKKVVFVLSGLVVFGISSFLWKLTPTTHHYQLSPLNSGGVAAGKTGAPGEANCTQCHSGTVQDGTAENVLVVSQGGTPVSSYVPGQQYNVTLSMVSNPAKRGFQATALSSSNVMAGAFTGVAGNTSINGGAKKYANHTSTSNTSASAPNWSWTWTAPAIGTGNVTFYVATNKTNNNGNNNGDLIYLSQFILQEASNAGVEENITSSYAIVGVSEQAITIKSNTELDRITGVSIHDANGKRIYFASELLSQNGVYTIIRPNQMQQGLHFVTFQANQKLITRKISL